MRVRSSVSDLANSCECISVIGLERVCVWICVTFYKIRLCKDACIDAWFLTRAARPRV
jgi:hypothetical protein